jgi:hypothetical protein
MLKILYKFTFSKHRKKSFETVTATYQFTEEAETLLQEAIVESKVIFAKLMNYCHLNFILNLRIKFKYFFYIEFFPFSRKLKFTNLMSFYQKLSKIYLSKLR